MDEDRVAAMSAALLSLGEKAAAGLGRGDLSQVYVEGETGTVFLISADDEAVLVAVAAAGAKAGLMLYEVRRAAAAIGEVLRSDAPVEETAPLDEAALAEAEAAYQAYQASKAGPAPVEPVAAPAPVLPSEPDVFHPEPEAVPNGSSDAASPTAWDPYETTPVPPVPAPSWS
jgi:hypothetical protein